MRTSYCRTCDQAARKPIGIEELESRGPACLVRFREKRRESTSEKRLGNFGIAG